MAEVPYQETPASKGAGKVLLVVWRGLTAGDVGAPYFTPNDAATVQMTGDFGGGVALEGALAPEGGWTVLSDHIGIPIVRRSPHLSSIAQRTYVVRPVAREGVRCVDVWLLVPTA